MRTRTLSLILLAALAALPALAQMPPPGGPGGHGGSGGPGMHGGPPPIEMLLRTLDLTTEQQAQVDTIMEARHAAGDAARPAMQAAHKALADQVRATPFDEAAIRTKAAAVAALDADRIVADAAVLRDVRAILTDAQRAKLDKLLEAPAPPSGGRGKHGA